MSRQERKKEMETKMETKRIVFISPLGREEAEMFFKTIPDGVAVDAKSITVAPFFDNVIEETVADFLPGLIVLNTILQGDDRDGLNVLRKIRKSQYINLKKVPTVVVAVLCTKQRKNEYINSGAVAVLPKFPYPPYEELMSYYCDD